MKLAAPRLDSRQEAWERKRNQKFLRDMHKYAESLSNAAGTGLESERISITKPLRDISNESQEEVKQVKKSAGGNKKTLQKIAKKNEMFQKLAANKARQEDENAKNIMAAWQVKCQSINGSKEPQVRYISAGEYLDSLNQSKRDVLQSEIELYMVNELLMLWISHCRQNKKSHGSGIAALILNRLRHLAGGALSISGITATKANETIRAMKLPIAPLQGALTNHALPFEFVLPLAKAEDLSIPHSSKEFQLTCCGPYMDRNIDPAPDSRVHGFHPDGWQRKVLDEIDANRSLLVVAPTSAGKTFISFYAMKRVLKADNDGVLVYVAPTKALVNQIAAEIQARFKKELPHAGKSIWAIHTRDYRINNPTGCQILVIVPHVLQILLLAPANANTWSTRVRKIIFDEIHCIGQADDGLVWEQLLLLAPRPIIALSATVGNPEAFNDWLVSIQEALGQEMKMIKHPYRYSDLRKFIYQPPEKFAFHGLESNTQAFGHLGLDGLPEFAFLHPIASLVNKARGMPDDLQLEPRDYLLLWQAMKRHQFHKDKRWDIDKELHPANSLPEVVRKIDVI